MRYHAEPPKDEGENKKSEIMKPIEIDKAVLFGYTGGMALYLPSWEAFLILFPKPIIELK